MKIGNINTVLAVVFGFVMLSSVATFVDSTFATININSSDSEAIA